MEVGACDRAACALKAGFGIIVEAGAEFVADVSFEESAFYFNGRACVILRDGCDGAAEAVFCNVVLEGRIGDGRFLLGLEVDRAAVVTAGVVLKGAIVDDQGRVVGDHADAGFLLGVLDRAVVHFEYHVLRVRLADPVRAEVDACPSGVVNGNVVHLDRYIGAAVSSQCVFAALDGAVLDVESGVALKAEGRSVGTIGVIDGMSAEVDRDVAAFLDVVAALRGEAVLVLIELIKVEAVILIGPEVDALGDREILVGGRSLRPCLGEGLEAFFLDAVYGLGEGDDRLDHIVVVVVVVDGFLVSVVECLHGLAEVLFHAFVVRVGILAFAYLIDALVDLILSDLVRHVVEGEHGDIVHTGVKVDGGQLAVDIVADDLQIVERILPAVGGFLILFRDLVKEVLGGCFVAGLSVGAQALAENVIAHDSEVLLQLREIAGAVCEDGFIRLIGVLVDLALTGGGDVARVVRDLFENRAVVVVEAVGCLAERLGIDRAVDDLEAVHLFLMILFHGLSEFIDLLDRVVDGLFLFFFFFIEDPVEQVAGAHLQQRSGDAVRDVLVDDLVDREV